MRANTLSKLVIVECRVEYNAFICLDNVENV